MGPSRYNCHLTRDACDAPPGLRVCVSPGCGLARGSGVLASPRVRTGILAWCGGLDREVIIFLTQSAVLTSLVASGAAPVLMAAVDISAYTYVCMYSQYFRSLRFCRDESRLRRDQSFLPWSLRCPARHRPLDRHSRGPSIFIAIFNLYCGSDEMNRW